VNLDAWTWVDPNARLSKGGQRLFFQRLQPKSWPFWEASQWFAGALSVDVLLEYLVAIENLIAIYAIKNTRLRTLHLTQEALTLWARALGGLIRHRARAIDHPADIFQCEQRAPDLQRLPLTSWTGRGAATKREGPVRRSSESDCSQAFCGPR